MRGRLRIKSRGKGRKLKKKNQQKIEKKIGENIYGKHDDLLLLSFIGIYHRINMIIIITIVYSFCILNVRQIQMSTECLVTNFKNGNYCDFVYLNERERGIYIYRERDWADQQTAKRKMATNGPGRVKDVNRLRHDINMKLKTNDIFIGNY